MKHFAAVLAIGGLLTLSPVWAAGQSAAPPSNAASVPKLPALSAKPASGPTTSPAVQAAENAAQPGKMRPESAVVPQVSVQLPSSKKSTDPASAKDKRPDDRAAACAAHVDKVEREKCQRSL